MARHGEVRRASRSQRGGLASALIVSLIATWLFLLPAKATDSSFIIFNDSVCDFQAAGYLGSGTSVDPFIISDSDSLWESIDCQTQSSPTHFQLASDIDTSLATHAPTYLPIGSRGDGTFAYFTGVFNGNSFAIKHDQVSALAQAQTASSLTAVGLFAGLDNASFENLELEVNIQGASTPQNSIFDLNYSTGGLAGRSIGRLVLESISLSATISGDRRVGGLVGNIESVTAANLYTNSTIRGSGGLGGFIGVSSGTAIITNSWNNSQVLGDLRSSIPGSAGGFLGAGKVVSIAGSQNFGFVQAPSFAGGVVGTSNSISFSSVINHASVRGADQNQAGFGSYAGGLLGVGGQVEIIDSANHGSVAIWGDYVGGLVASAEFATISGSLNTGDVAAAGQEAAGLVATTRKAVIADSMNAGQIVATNGISGIVGSARIGVELENTLNMGELVILSGPSTSTVLSELGVVPTTNQPSNLTWDGLLGSGLLQSTGSFSIAPLSRSQAIDASDLAVPGNFSSWDLSSTWGFDCSSNNRHPQLRSQVGPGTLLQPDCTGTAHSDGPQVDSEVIVSPPATGPKVTGTYSALASTSLTISGSLFNTVQTLFIGSHSAQVLAKSDAYIEIQIPAEMPAGLYNLSLETSLGQFVFVDLLEIRQVDPTPTFSPGGMTVTIRKFAKSSNALSAAQLGQIAWALSAENSNNVVCTAVVAPEMRLSLRLAVIRQARAVCAAATELSPSLNVRVQSKSTVHSHMHGRVLFTFVN